MMELTARQQEVLQYIQSHPTSSLREIGNAIGISYERVRQLSAWLTEQGVIENRNALKAAALERQTEEEKAAKDHKKTIWRRMMFISQRQVYRHLARVDQYGFARAHHQPGQEAICLFQGCTRSVRARGFCGWHYGKLRSHGAIWVRRSSRSTCKELQCIYPVYARGMCHNHYNNFKRHSMCKSVLTNHNTSGYRGVSWDKSGQRWAVNIVVGGDQKYLGEYALKETAARAYDTAARRYHGAKAKLNFPDENIEVTKEGRTPQKPGASGVLGVSWDNSRSRWKVMIHKQGKCIFSARFTDLDAAIAAHKTALEKYTHVHRP